jgi:hypothetical protein
MYSTVSVGVLGEWCRKDKWVERRQINLEKWRSAIENKIGSELVRLQRNALQRFDEILDKLLRKIEKEVVSPKSHEGLVSSAVKVQTLMNDLNEKIAKAVIPDMPSSPTTVGPPEQTRPRLSQLEAREAARLILDLRRKEMRAKVAREAAEQEEAQRPKLTVVEGE